tara:strand:- start:2336 stop:3208 length:873 start_codon:yes stop_codon:yes gene_type:complete
METLEFSGEEILFWRKKLLSNGGRAVDLDWLLDLGGGLQWGELQKLLIDPSQSLTLDQSLDYLASLWQEHIDKQIPLQHLLGRCPWRDFELEVSSAALIPRQETEILMELALTRFDKNFLGLWADLGTGSGALAVDLARSFPHAEGHAVDCSQAALSLASRNLKRLAPLSNVHLHLGSWWQPLRPWWGKIGLVLANPPYIPTAVLNRLDPIVRDNEPHLALCGGPDGLNAFREIIARASKAIVNNGWLMLEHHHDQSDPVLELLIKAGFKDVCYAKDLDGIKRFALGRNK